MNHEERLAYVEQQTQNIMSYIQGIPGVRATVLDNVIGHQPFGVQLEVDSTVTGITIQEVVEKLKNGNPPIWTRVRDGEDFMIIHGFGLAQGEDEIVGRRIAALFADSDTA